MGCVSIPPVEAAEDFFFRDFSSRIRRPPVFHPAADGVHFVTPEFHRNLAGVAQIGVETQEINPVLQREDAGLFIELQLDVPYPLAYFLQQAPELLLAIGDDVEIVHVPAVKPAPAFLLDEVVKLVEKKQRQQLAGLIAERKTRGGINVDAQQLVDFRVYVLPLQRLPQFLFQYVVVDGGEKLSHISLQDPSVGALMASVILDHVMLQPHQRIVGSLLFLTRSVVTDKAGAYSVVEDVIDYGV